tara:strand:- start:851 stop:1399 length:549 start_codon:yes stop_codon:yes gene_type:complete
MSLDSRKIKDKNILAFKEISKEKPLNTEHFSKGMYDWIMFVLNFYVRVREKLKIDFDSFVILQVVVSHSLYEINKTGPKTFLELGHQMSLLGKKKMKNENKLTFASVSDVLNLPRETVRRKVIYLTKINILNFDSEKGIKLGKGYKDIYEDFVKHTTVDLSTLAKKWKKNGVLENLLLIDNV